MSARDKRVAPVSPTTAGEIPRWQSSRKELSRHATINLLSRRHSVALMTNWYPWYYDDYERDAGHLDHISDSCYRRIIDFYMRTREPIPRDPVRLMFITRTSPDQFAMVWARLEPFFILKDGFLHLRRCNVELDRQDRMSRQQSHAGQRSAEKRKQQHQLLTNDRSTSVQRPFNVRSTDSIATGQDRTGEDIERKIDSSIGETVPPSRKSASAAPLPPGWVPTDQQRAFAERMGLVNGAIEREAAKFEAYWTIGNGNGTRRTEKGWSQTWITWISKSAKDATNSRGPNGSGNRNPQSHGFSGLASQVRAAGGKSDIPDE